MRIEIGLMKPGIKIKRWIFIGLFGILLIAFGFTEISYT